jgi:MoaA/NifB/PqqE/SkfB family radical SAM enzyme
MRLINHPVLCNYYVTYRCNASCHFCDIWEKPSPYINLNDAFQNLYDLKRLGVNVVDFTGGEPLLHRDISLLLQKAKELKFITTLTTNCLLYPKNAEKLRGLIDMLHFSLDYYNKDKHDNARGVRCFDNVLESINIAKELGERPDILFTAFDDNLEELQPIYDHIIIPNNLVLIINPSFSYNEIAVPSLSKSSIDYLRNWGAKKNVYLNDGFLKLRENGGNKLIDPVCKAASTTIVISPENELVLPCYHLGIKSIPIKKDLFKIYNSSEVKKMIKMEGRYPKCEGCVINCYMQPSFATNLNKYFWAALPSTLKYNYLKGTWKQLALDRLLF